MAGPPVLRWEQARVVAWPGEGDPAAERFEVAVPAPGPGLGKLLGALAGAPDLPAGIAGLECHSTVQADGSYLLHFIGLPAAKEPVTRDTVLAVLRDEVEALSEEP